MKNLKRIVKRIITFPTRVPYYMAHVGVYNNENVKRIQSYKNKYYNKRCFIIGGGPSINNMNLDYLNGEITFVHNAFYLIQDRVEFNPTFTIVEDPLPAEDNADELNSLNNTTKFFAHDLKYCLEHTENSIFVNFHRNYVNYKSNKFPKFSEDASKIVYWGGTVVYMSLQLAYYMGFNEVYLIGIDLSYDIPKHAQGKSLITSKEPDTNHFHPDYFGSGKRWHDPKVERMQQAIEYAAKYFDDNGRHLFNSTEGGNLKRVVRKDYYKLFNIKNY